MKHLTLITIVIALCICLFGCSVPAEAPQIVATTLPVYEFTSILCEGTDLRVTQLITESVSCLHDYTLQVTQMRSIENAQFVVISGLGLEDFLDDALTSAHSIIDASAGIDPICHNSAHDHDHQHQEDPHIWLSPAMAKKMSENICQELSLAYPIYADRFSLNLSQLTEKLDTIQLYAQQQLSDIACREIVTFHDGFSYMADAFDLHIVHAIEEESGREASAAELIGLAKIVFDHKLSAIFTETNGSTAAAEIIAAETGAEIYQLNMGMSGNSYFEAMYQNIKTLKEALE